MADMEEAARPKLQIHMEEAEEEATAEMEGHPQFILVAAVLYVMVRVQAAEDLVVLAVFQATLVEEAEEAFLEELTMRIHHNMHKATEQAEMEMVMDIQVAS